MSEAEPRIEIDAARFPDDHDVVSALFLEYVDWLDVDLHFQGFEGEVADLPGKYVAPAGGLWLARSSDQPAGVVALRPLEGMQVCEMKRLWVRPAFRGQRLGRRLIETVVNAAREAGYLRMRLDTLPQMAQAQALYRTFDFQEIAPYYDNPIAGTRYLELNLQD